MPGKCQCGNAPKTAPTKMHFWHPPPSSTPSLFTIPAAKVFLTQQSQGKKSQNLSQSQFFVLFFVANLLQHLPRASFYLSGRVYLSATLNLLCRHTHTEKIEKLANSFSVHFASFIIFALRPNCRLYLQHGNGNACAQFRISHFSRYPFRISISMHISNSSSSNALWKQFPFFVYLVIFSKY